MFNKTQQYVQHMQDRKVIPGASYAFIDGNRVEIHTSGYRSIEPFVEEMTEDTQFDIASLTKVVGTTTVIFQLLQEGLIKLDDPVYLYLPIKSHQLTIADLLLHRSDFQGYIPQRDQLSKKELCQALLTQMTPGNEVGKRVKYSDLNYIYLGWIAESVTGDDIHTLIENRVIMPLKLSHTTFQPLKKQCAPTENHNDRGIIRGVVHDPKAFRIGSHCGSAGLFSTIGDLIKFCQMYLRDGETVDDISMINREWLLNLSQPITSIEQGQERTFGWVIESIDNHYALTHTGYTGTYLWIDLSWKRAFIFLSNRIHPIDDNERYLKYRDQLIQVWKKEQSED